MPNKKVANRAQPTKSYYDICESIALIRFAEVAWLVAQDATHSGGTAQDSNLFPLIFWC